MKKLIIALMLACIAIGGCTNNDNTPTDFEEVEKVDIQINDYIEPSDEQSPPVASEDNNINPDDNVSNDTPVSTPSTQTPSTSSPGQTPQDTQEFTPPADVPATPDNDKDTANENLSGKIICIDAGHGIFKDAKNEPLYPDSTVTKPGNKEGTKGKVTIEDEITLAVANKTKTLLEELGATVLMTRTDENSTMTNMERALYANDNNAQIVIKLHADGTKEGGRGMTMLYPSSKYIADKQLISDSKRLATAIMNNAKALTGAKNRGIYANSQMAGFNWSKVPVVLFEMGFMTNINDENNLKDDNYQSKIAQAIVAGILEYYK